MTTLVSGVGGAIGSDVAASKSRVWFVEFNGKLSYVDLVRGLAGVLSTGTGTLHGTWLFDLESGAEAGPGTAIPAADADIWWEQKTATARQMTPRNGAQIAWLGNVPFGSVSHADLQQLTYSTTPIDGSVGSTNQLTPGTVFAVRTRSGNYAKVRVVSYGYNLSLEWRVYRLTDAYTVAGTGYTQPEDVALSVDGVHAYVTERSGNLLRVTLSNANRSAATVVASGMTAPHQIVLDESLGVAYVVEFASNGRLIRVDLASCTQTVLCSGLENAIGLALSEDARVAYVTEQAASGGRLSRVDLVANRKETVVSGLVSPFFLEWTDASRGALYVVERDPNNRVLVVVLNSPAPTATAVLTGLPARPSSMVVVVGGKAVVCANDAVVLADLASVFTASDPYFLGIGHVPATEISAQGYATTAAGYFFQVTDAPFGGTLALQVNHDRAFADGARYYKIYVDGAQQTASFSDYEWVGILSRFVLRTVSPDDSGYFPVRTAASLWYNHWLGFQLDTTAFTNGLHSVEVRFYSAANAASQLVAQTVHVQVDNTWPLVTIDAIEHRRTDGTWEAIGRCAIVTTNDNAFRFRVTARDPEKHLLSWSLGAAWGDNESAGIASGSYTAGTIQWEGPAGELVPAGEWAATERRCAHTFRLGAWDRVINGWGYLHYKEYSKSITIYLP